jgi:hypothetical protein
MCRFKSAIVTKDGAILHSDYSDSHEELIAAFDLKDNEDHLAKFVRVEFVPKSDDTIADPDSYSLIVDQSPVPVWFDADRREAAAEYLRGLVRRMIVTGKRKALLGGAWILAGKAEVGLIQGARIVNAGYATIQYAGSATIQNAGHATIQYAGYATIQHAGYATIQDAGYATIQNAGSATIQHAGHATIQHAGYATIQNAGHATIQYAGSATIQHAGYATIQHAAGRVRQRR